ncbi:hypothetical protein FB451DRAFT_1372407 [Mycena latifolia]|nr:hypothetical protein FB451DRAFT_1372407 [Mycena latifolia]
MEHVVHPDIKKYNKSFATSSKEIRHRRSNNTVACALCFKTEGPEIKLRHCAKCNHAMYCSKEACFIMAFDLLRHPVGLDKPFAARLDIGVEPTDIIEFMNIYHNAGQPVENVEGMVQLNGFMSLPDTSIGEGQTMAWRKTREAIVAAGLPAASVGILVVSKANALVITCPFIISQHAMDFVRRAPKLNSVSALTGQVTEHAFSIDSCMEIMNKHIRADDKNQLSLRMEMSGADIQTIRDARNTPTTRSAHWGAVAPPSHFGALLLKEKMARESLYKPTITIEF